MSLSLLLSDVGEFIVSHLTDADVTRLVQTCKDMRRTKQHLLKLLVASHIPAHLYAPSSYLSVGSKYFAQPLPLLYSFSMSQCINEIIVCDFRAFLWGDVERCMVDGMTPMAPLRAYVLNGLERVRYNAIQSGGFSTYAGRQYLASQSLVRPRPVQYPVPRLPGGGGDYRAGPGVQLQEQLPRGRANRVRVDPVQAEPGAGAVPSPHRGPGPALERPAGTGFSQVGVGPEETVLFRARAAGGGGVNSRNRF